MARRCFGQLRVDDGVLDSTIVNVALPQIQGAVGATLQQITWVATGYTIAAVLLMPLVAFLGRRFGRSACTCSASGCSCSEAPCAGSLARCSPSVTILMS